MKIEPVVTNLYRYVPKNLDNELEGFQKRRWAPEEGIIVDLRNYSFLPDNWIPALVEKSQDFCVILLIDQKSHLERNLYMHTLVKVLPIFYQLMDAEYYFSEQQLTANVNIGEKTLYFALRGTVIGKSSAQLLLHTVEHHSRDFVVINLDECYYWDQDHAETLKKIRQHHKTFLVRKENQTIEQFFHLKDDKVYQQQEEVDKLISLAENKNYQVDLFEVEKKTVIGLAGYVTSNRLSSFIRNLKRKLDQNECHIIDFNEIYFESEMDEDEDQTRFLPLIEVLKENNASEESQVVVTMDLPRVDQNENIYWDVFYHLYQANFVILPQIEDALHFYTQNQSPHFTLENSLSLSLMKVRGNILHAEYVRTFRQMVNSMMDSSIRLQGFAKDKEFFTSSNCKITLFDFSDTLYLSRYAVEKILQLRYPRNYNLVRGVILNERLQYFFDAIQSELTSKRIHDQVSLEEESFVFYYSSQKEAIRQHLWRILLVVDGKENHEVSTANMAFWQKKVSKWNQAIKDTSTSIKDLFRKIEFTIISLEADRFQARLAENFDLVIYSTLEPYKSNILNEYRESGHSVLELRDYTGEECWKLRSYQYELYDDIVSPILQILNGHPLTDQKTFYCQATLAGITYPLENTFGQDVREEICFVLQAFGENPERCYRCQSLHFDEVTKMTLQNYEVGIGVPLSSFQLEIKQSYQQKWLQFKVRIEQVKETQLFAAFAHYNIAFFPEIFSVNSDGFGHLDGKLSTNFVGITIRLQKDRYYPAQIYLGVNLRDRSSDIQEIWNYLQKNLEGYQIKNPILLVIRSVVRELISEQQPQIAIVIRIHGSKVKLHVKNASEYITQMAQPKGIERDQFEIIAS